MTAEIEWLPGQDSRFEACWRHEGALARMDYAQALDYAEACGDCVVQHRDVEPVAGQVGLPIQTVVAPVLAVPDSEVELGVNSLGVWGPVDTVPDDDPDVVDAEIVEDPPAEPDMCPRCGLEIFNAATHVCQTQAAPPAAAPAPLSAPQPLEQPDVPAADTSHAAGLGEEALFDEADWRASPTANLRARFTEPPFTVLDRKGGGWIERDRRWKALGIQSELGRADDLLEYGGMNSNGYNEGQFSSFQSTSIFSPTLAELAVRWYSAPDSQVLDPFAGGSVRGLVTGIMRRHYTGIDLRAEQVAANTAQAHISDGHTPQWLAGDSADLAQLLPTGQKYDLVFSCPPYAYLEEYSDDPRDLSSLQYPQFLEAYQRIIDAAVDRLNQDRFVAWVIGEVREKGGHSCLGLVPDTIKAFQKAGLTLYNDHVILTPIGSVALRAPKQFNASRKAGRIHEYMLVFVKGDGKRAARWAAAHEGPL